MNGSEAKSAFDQANNLVKLGRYAEALAVEMLESDRRVIEAKIRKCAKGTNE